MKKKEISKDKIEKRLSTYIGVIVISLFFVNSADIFQEIINNRISAILISNTMKALCVGYFIYIIPIVLKRLNRKIIFFTMLCIIVTLLNLLFFNNNLKYFKNTIFVFFTICYTSYITICIIEDYSILRNILLKISRFIAIITSIFLILSLTGSINSLKDENYRMGLGYALLMPILMLIWNYIEKKEKIDFFEIISVLFFIILYTSRGPLVVVVLFNVYFLIRYWLKQRKYVWIILLTVSIIVFSIFSSKIFILLAKELETIGIQSRTITLIENNLAQDSGREKIYSKLLQIINENPFTIRGINADYLVVGGYSHNLFIELIYEFGIVIGGIAILTIIYNIIKTLFIYELSDYGIFALILMFISISSLMVSSSLWISYYFWMWLSAISCIEWRSNKGRS